MSPTFGLRYSAEFSARLLVRSLRGHFRAIQSKSVLWSPAMEVCDADSWTILEPEERCYYPIPSYWPNWARNHHWLPRSTDGSAFELSHRAAWVCSFDDAVCMPDGRLIALDRNGSVRAWVVDDVNGLSVSEEEYDNSRAVAEASRREGDCVVPVGLIDPENYYHWTFQSLPRVALALRYLGSEKCSFYVGQTQPRFVGDSLAALGVGKDRIISGDPVRARSVLAHTPSMQPPSWVVRFLRETADRVCGSGRAGSDRIYYHRGSSKRRIVNHEEVIEQVERHGFRVVYPGQMSFEEQLRGARNAGYLMGAHGACFTNIAYSQPPATIIEFIPSNCPEPYFMLLAADVGLSHRALFGNEPRVRDLFGRRPFFDYRADSRVDIRALHQVLESI